MATKLSTNLTAFDEFFNVQDKAKSIQEQKTIPIDKNVLVKKPSSSVLPKINKPIINKTQSEEPKPAIVKNTEEEKGTTDADKSKEVTQITVQRIGFSTILKPDLIRKLKLKALNDDIDIYEAVEKAIELYINN